MLTTEQGQMKNLSLSKVNTNVPGITMPCRKVWRYSVVVIVWCGRTMQFVQLGSLELGTSGTVVGMQTLKTRRQNGVGRQEGQKNSHGDNVVGRKKSGKKKAQWEGR